MVRAFLRRVLSFTLQLRSPLSTSRIAKAAKGVIVSEAPAPTHVPALAKSTEAASSREKMAGGLSTGTSPRENLEVAYPNPAMGVSDLAASSAPQSRLGA